MNEIRQMTMREMVEAIWRLPRDLVSDGYDEALRILGSQVSMTIHEYPSGEECFTWIIPEKWTCREARLETLGGKVLFTSRDNPLHVVSYSLPFEGIVSRDELFAHLFTHLLLPDAVPFVFKYYQRDWGLCCSENLKRTLGDEAYRVKIDSEFSPGKLKVGEVMIRGELEECIVLCAHLCHPGMVNDDLSGVVAGVDVMRLLRKRANLRYTYRLLLLPETIGSAAWLAHNEKLIPLLKGGLFLEMLGTPHPHVLQRSYRENSEMDLLAELIMHEQDPKSRSAGFMKVILNDERMFNSPGIRVPMVSLSRVLPAGHAEWPYREYHSSFDDPDHVHWSNLEASRDLVLAILEALERNRIPTVQYKGELFCSRFPAIDYHRMRDFIHSVPYYMDGRRTVAEIASRVCLPFTQVADFLDILVSQGLVKLDVPQETK